MTTPDSETFAETTEVTVNLNRGAMSALYRVTAEAGISRTDVMNRALQLYATVLDLPANRTMSFIEPDGSVRTLLALEAS